MFRRKLREISPVQFPLSVAQRLHPINGCLLKGPRCLRAPVELSSVAIEEEKYMLYAAREVRIGKNYTRGLPKAFSRMRAQFSPVRTNLVREIMCLVFFCGITVKGLKMPIVFNEKGVHGLK